MLKKTIVNEQGHKRYAVKCRGCKERFITEVAYYTDLAEVHSCEKIEAWKSARPLGPDKDRNNYRTASQWFKWDTVRGSYNEEKFCDGRCMGAKGPNCECSCGGENHGMNAMIG